MALLFGGGLLGLATFPLSAVSVLSTIFACAAFLGHRVLIGPIPSPFRGKRSFWHDLPEPESLGGGQVENQLLIG
ncbi:MAG: hypothetical protein OEM22_00380 [Acidimicrobiia bacterium]|nr:hypothetical protein [Acidimicrobiia bacterium]